MQFVVASLIGIPGSGKTTFSRKILWMAQESLLNVSTIIISFDDHIQLDYSCLNDGEYKESRENLLKNVENLMSHLLTENDLARWNDILSSHELKINQDCFCLRVNCPTLIILDDNMYFRSMRQRVRSICRRLDCRHFQILMKIPYEKALKQTSKRLVNKVPAFVIERMNQLMEAPSNPRTLVIEEGLCQDKICELINDRIENPETATKPQETEVKLKQSIVHQMDIITRRELSNKIKGLKSYKELPSICLQLNKKRKDFLEILRNREERSFDEIPVEALREEFIKILVLPQ